MRKLSLFGLALVLGLVSFMPQAFAVPTTLTVQEVTETSAVARQDAADTVNGNRFSNPSGDILLLCQNNHATNAGTVTITAQRTSATIPGYGVVSRADVTMSLAAGDYELVGPFSPFWYNDSNGYVQITYAGTGTLKCTAFKARDLGRRN